MYLKPCTAFETNTPIQQLEHIKQEVNEVMQAWNDWQFRDGGEDAKLHMAEELVDLQTTCETMLLIMEFDAQARDDIRVTVMLKNWLRGYLE